MKSLDKTVVIRQQLPPVPVTQLNQELSVGLVKVELGMMDPIEVSSLIDHLKKLKKRLEVKLEQLKVRHTLLRRKKVYLITTTIHYLRKVIKLKGQLILR
jgi:hypothetical protein